MPLDLTQPIEANRGSQFRELEVLSRNGDTVDVRYTNNYGEHRTAQFHAVTGVMLGQEETDDQTRIRNQSGEVANHYFRVWFGRIGDDGWTKDQWRYLENDAEYQFTTGKEAAAKVKELNNEAKEAGASWRFMTKPHTEMAPDHKWREWMEERFATGQYTPVPWANEEWVIKDHFAHPSLSDPFKLAYVADEVAGVADKITTQNAGRYLQQFYGNILNQQEIAKWAIALDNECELKITMDGDEIERIYTQGRIDSCMRYSAAHFGMKQHPVQVYAAGDLGLIYLERRGKVIARAICWPEKKIVQRVYGDSERMKMRLEAEGYTLTTSEQGRQFYGARLRKKKRSRGAEGEIVMPYLDWGWQAMDNPDDDKTLIVCGQADMQYPCQSTSGYSSGYAMQSCARHGCNHQYRSNVPGCGYVASLGRTFCPTCTSSHVRTCGECGSQFSTEIQRGDRGRICIERAQSNGAPNSRFVCTECASAYGYIRATDGYAYWQNDTVTLPDGTIVGRRTPAAQAQMESV